MSCVIAPSSATLNTDDLCIDSPFIPVEYPYKFLLYSLSILGIVRNVLQSFSPPIENATPNLKQQFIA